MTFRDAIMRSLHQATHDQCEAPDLRDMPINECDDDREGWIGDVHVAYDLTADALLAMPEMQAIRSALLAFANNESAQWGDSTLDDVRWRLARRHVPETVIEWVLS